MNQQSPAQAAEALIREETELLVAQARANAQIEQIKARLSIVQSALEGVNLGRALAAQEVAASISETPDEE